MVDPALSRLNSILTESSDGRLVLSAAREVFNRAGIEFPEDQHRREMDFDTAMAIIDKEIERLQREMDELEQ